MNGIDNKADFIKNLNIIVSVILVIVGVLLTISLINNFSKSGMFSSAKLEPSEIIIALLAGFYHLLFAGLCYATSTAFNSSKKDISWLKNALDVFGWGSIIIGCIGVILILTKTSDIGPFSRYGVLGAFMIGLYSATFGSLCLGKSLVLSWDDKTSLQPAAPKQSPSKKSKTICPNCKKNYDGDLTGQFCEECGTQFP